MTKQTVFRQGDVVLRRTTKTPSAAAKPVTDAGRTILAYGEVTGHYHEVIEAAPIVGDPDGVPPCQLFEEPDGSRILVLSRPSILRHDEHDPIALEGGQTYEIVRQCEWSLDDVRRVAD